VSTNYLRADDERRLVNLLAMAEGTRWTGTIDGPLTDTGHRLRYVFSAGRVAERFLAEDLVAMRKPGAHAIPDPLAHDPRVCGDHAAGYPDEHAIGGWVPDCLCTCNRCGLERGEPFYGPLCEAAYAVGCDHWTCGAVVANHDGCPIEQFHADPITQAYGLGGDWDEWSRVITCALCQVRERAYDEPGAEHWR
jgi:hypothetical protein